MGSINWKDLMESASDSNYDPLPADQYDVTLSTVELVKSASGKDMFKIRHKVESGPYAGRIVFDQWVISLDNDEKGAQSRSILARKMRAVGIDPAFFASAPSTEAVGKTMIGKRCSIRVSIREWQGQSRNQVDAIIPAKSQGPSAPAGQPVSSPGGLSQFAPTPNIATSGGGGSPAMSGQMVSSTTAPPNIPF